MAKKREEILTEVYKGYEYTYQNSTLAYSSNHSDLGNVSAERLDGLTLEQLLQVVDENYFNIDEQMAVPTEVRVLDTSTFMQDDLVSIGLGGQIANHFNEGIAAAGTLTYGIPSNVGGVAIIVEDGGGANSYALIAFNNDGGTLSVTEVVDSGGFISTSGTDIIVTNNGAGTGKYYATFIGRNVTLITAT